MTGFVSPAEAFRARSNANPEALFLTAPAAAELSYAKDGFAYSYGDVESRMEAARADFARAGYGHGSCVALMLDNRPEFFWVWLALNALGVSILPLNSDLKPADLAYQLAMVVPDFAIALPERQALLRAADSNLRIIAVGESAPKCQGRVTRVHGEIADPCALMFTSGTTGNPKCCVLSNDYFMRLANWYVTQGGIASMQDGKETVLTPLPMFHMNALACSTLGMILKGGTLVPLDRFHANRWWRTVAAAGATVVHYLGVMPAILLKLDEQGVEREHRVRFGFGAGVDPRHQERFEERFGFPLIEGWAMTETGSGAVTSTADCDRHIGLRCIGVPTPGMEYRIVDDNSVDVAQGEAGELLVRARGAEPRRGFFSEYLKDKAATDAVWAGGWFHTGDVVRSDGTALFFVDRKKNIVRRSGENIAVVEVEGVLGSLDEVAACAVAPVDDEIRGEEVFALVKLAAAPPVDIQAARHLAERIASACSERLAYYKVPGYVAFVDTLPVTATQKLQRGETRRAAQTALGAPDTIDLREFKGKLRLRDKAGAA
jgi:acyl-CoA synthetase (AMP-forming)/AMP-acid ligase II